VTQYSEEFKANIIAKMLPPNNVSVPQLVRETGIPKDTLYTWRSKHRKATGDATVQALPPGELNSEEKFAVVIESASLNEAELSEYCRRKGLYAQQINAWKASCMQANCAQAPIVDRTQLKVQAKHIKQLETELRRKEKALAEAAALLILQKKVQALWEEPEDAKSDYGRARR
jgi:transposase-like protein